MHENMKWKIGLPSSGGQKGCCRPSRSDVVDNLASTGWVYWGLLASAHLYSPGHSLTPLIYTRVMGNRFMDTAGRSSTSQSEWRSAH